jgi:hypothetical protein
MRITVAIYAPMIYTAPCVMLLIRAASITRASGRGLGPGNQDFSGPVKWHQADRQVPFGAKKVEISRANSLPLAQVMDAACIKTIMHRAV